MSETFFITGANCGIGLAVTKVLLDQGDKVFAACREPQKAAELGTLKKNHPDHLDLVPLEVDSDSSVSAAVKTVSGKTKHLDVVFNNAGIQAQPYNAHLEQVDLSKM